MNLQINTLIATLIIIAWTPRIHGIIGYDYGSVSANLTTLSLINIEECDIP